MGYKICDGCKQLCPVKVEWELMRRGHRKLDFCSLSCLISWVVLEREQQNAERRKEET